MIVTCPSDSTWVLNNNIEYIQLKFATIDKLLNIDDTYFLLMSLSGIFLLNLIANINRKRVFQQINCIENWKNHIILLTQLKSIQNQEQASTAITKRGRRIIFS